MLFNVYYAGCIKTEKRTSQIGESCQSRQKWLFQSRGLYVEQICLPNAQIMNILMETDNKDWVYSDPNPDGQQEPVMSNDDSVIDDNDDVVNEIDIDNAELSFSNNEDD